MGLSTQLSHWMGRCFTQSFITPLITHCARTIWCSKNPSELVPNTFINSSRGSSTTSQESLGTSSPINLNNMSAGVFIFPAIWMILKLQSCSCSCQRAILLFNFFRDSQNVRFLWSVSMMNGVFVQIRYGLQFSRAFITTKNSYSQMSYLCLVGVNMAEQYAIGCYLGFKLVDSPFCESTAPMPYTDALVCRQNILLKFGYQSTSLVHILFFSLSNTFC